MKICGDQAFRIMELDQQNMELLGALEELAENYCYICSNGKKYCHPECGELDKYKQLIAKTKGETE
jgi:hypothetical protein